MGINGSIESNPLPFNEHFFGLVNFGNTCYVNSVLQALYFCKPFRDQIIQYKLAYNHRTLNLSNKDISSVLNSNGNDFSNDSNLSNSTNGNSNGVNNSNEIKNVNGTNGNSILKQEHLLNCLAELFHQIVTMKKKKGIMQPKKFIARLRKDNDAFDNLFQQDAHEFLNYLLNTCADILKAEMKELKELKRIEEQNRLNESLVRLNTKTHKNLHNKPVTNNNTNHINHSNGAVSSSIVNNKNTTSTNQSTGSNNTNNNSISQNNQKTHHSNGGGGNSNSGSSKSLTSENSLNSTKNSQNYSPHHDHADDLNKINLIDASANNGVSGVAAETTSEKKEELTWIHDLFQGILVNETKCLNCETSSSKEENFLDLSVDVEQNTSISHCLQEFSNMEMLCGECKYYCENCGSKQEAEKRMRIKKLPRILALHLKRFKFVGVLNKFKKLTYRVVFPFELRLFNTTDDCSNSDRIYDLVSFVVHCGMGLNRGHYISVVKSHGYWFLFDDEQVEKIEVSNFEEFYGLTQDTNKKSETCYILFYESRQA